MGLMGFLAIVGLIAGILVGTHAPWYVEIGIVVIAGVLLEKANLEMEAIIYIPMIVLFAVGCVIGDISWALQTGAVVFEVPDVTNPFAVDK